MYRLRVVMGVLAAALVVGTLSGDDKKDPPKGKGTLPTYFKSLGLSDEQTAKVKLVHAEYKEKIDELEQKVKDLKAAERSQYEKILTADQKRRLREILEKKAFGGDSSKVEETKKP
ncbi:MAG: hypothetical protein ACJ8FY_25150 [Gemmataceae bacterium]